MASEESTVEYREIPEFPGYRVGDDGSVWSSWSRGQKKILLPEWRKLKPTKINNGYLHVSLYRQKKEHRRSVHRLVLEVFVGPCPEGMEACHFPDRSRDNCRLTNLRWDTKSANTQDQIRHGTFKPGFILKPLRGTQCIHAKLTPELVVKIREMRAEGMRAKEIAQLMGIDATGVYAVVNRKRWAHIA